MVNAPTQTSLVVRLSPVHGQGRYHGGYALSWPVAALVAPLMSGFVIDRLGAEWLCAAVGTVTAARHGALMRRLPAQERVVPAKRSQTPASEPVREQAP